MNDDTPQPNERERREARILGLLLGELTETEAAEAERWLIEDPDLQAYKDVTERLLNLVGETIRFTADNCDDCGKCMGACAQAKTGSDGGNGFLKSSRNQCPARWCGSPSRDRDGSVLEKSRTGCDSLS